MSHVLLPHSLVAITVPITNTRVSPTVSTSSYGTVSIPTEDPHPAEHTPFNNLNGVSLARYAVGLWRMTRIKRLSNSARDKSFNADDFPCSSFEYTCYALPPSAFLPETSVLDHYGGWMNNWATLLAGYRVRSGKSIENFSEDVRGDLHALRGMAHYISLLLVGWSVSKQGCMATRISSGVSAWCNGYSDSWRLCGTGTRFSSLACEYKRSCDTLQCHYNHLV